MTAGAALLLSSWWPTASSPHANPFIVDHAIALEKAVGEVHCCYVVPGLAVSGAAPTRHSGAPQPTMRAPRVPYRMACGTSGARLLHAAGWTAGRRARQRPSVVVVHGFDYAGPYAAGFASATRRPLVYVEHWSAVAQSQLSEGHRRSLQHVLARADRILAVSPNLAVALQNAGGETVAGVQLVNNPVDPELFTASSPPKRKGTLIAQIADFRPVKGHDLLVEALLLLGDDLVRDDVRLVLVGDGPERPRIQERIVRSGLDGRVAFLGKLSRSEVAEVIRNADWTLLTSKSENAPCVVAESLCVGRPVAVPRVGGLEAMLTDGDGILFDRTARGLVGAIKAMTTRNGADGSTARARAAGARFSPEGVANTYRAVLEGLVAA